MSDPHTAPDLHMIFALLPLHSKTSMVRLTSFVRYFARTRQRAIWDTLYFVELAARLSDYLPPRVFMPQNLLYWNRAHQKYFIFPYHKRRQEKLPAPDLHDIELVETLFCAQRPKAMFNAMSRDVQNRHFSGRFTDITGDKYCEKGIFISGLLYSRNAYGRTSRVMLKLVVGQGWYS